MRFPRWFGREKPSSGEPNPEPANALRVLFLDDDPQRAEIFLAEHPSAVCIQTVAECLVRLEEPWHEVHLDHDLGGEQFVNLGRTDCGMEVVRWLCAAPRPHLRATRFWVHSHNAVAAATMGMELVQAGYQVELRPFGGPPPPPLSEEDLALLDQPLARLVRDISDIFRSRPKPVDDAFRPGLLGRLVRRTWFLILRKKDPLAEDLPPGRLARLVRSVWFFLRRKPDPMREGAIPDRRPGTAAGVERVPQEGFDLSWIRGAFAPGVPRTNAATTDRPDFSWTDRSFVRPVGGGGQEVESLDLSWAAPPPGTPIPSPRAATPPPAAREDDPAPE
jgi:hypothetical protein